MLQHSRFVRRTFPLVLLAMAIATGCQHPQSVDIDLSSSPVRFVVNHRGWPRPFWAPRVREFAIATEEEPMWQLEAIDDRGEPARELAIPYGKTPPGFRQVYPDDNQSPQPLARGRTYFVAAGGRTTVYLMVFSLPVDPLEVSSRWATTAPGK